MTYRVSQRQTVDWLMLGGTLLQLAGEAPIETYDVVWGPVRFNYPTGDSLSDEMFVGGLVWLLNKLAARWESLRKAQVWAVEYEEEHRNNP